MTAGTEPAKLEAALALVGLWLGIRQRRRFEGQLFLILLMSHIVLRFVLENLRGDPERGEALGFSVPQLLSLALFPVAAISYSQLHKLAKHSN